MRNVIYLGQNYNALEWLSQDGSQWAAVLFNTTECSASPAVLATPFTQEGTCSLVGMIVNGTITATWIVNPANTTTTSSSTTGSPATIKHSFTNFWLIGGILGGILVVSIALAIYFIKHRQKNTADYQQINNGSFQ